MDQNLPKSFLLLHLRIFCVIYTKKSTVKLPNENEIKRNSLDYVFEMNE